MMKFLCKRRSRKKLQNSLQAVLNDLGYDFDQFTLPHFIQWMEQKTGKTFHFLPEDLVETGVFGAWVSSPYKEIFLIEKGLKIHQKQQTILHEISHLICAHKTETVSAPEADRIVKFGGVRLDNALLRGCLRPSERELEAETMASLIQAYQVRRNRRQRQFNGGSSSDETETYLAELGLI